MYLHSHWLIRLLILRHLLSPADCWAESRYRQLHHLKLRSVLLSSFLARLQLFLPIAQSATVVPARLPFGHHHLSCLTSLFIFHLHLAKVLITSRISTETLQTSEHFLFCSSDCGGHRRSPSSEHDMHAQWRIKTPAQEESKRSESCLLILRLFNQSQRTWKDRREKLQEN